MTKRTEADVASRIRGRRLDIGLTQAQLGHPRFTSAYISLIECGHRRPSEDTLRFIAERLDLKLEELLTGVPAGLEARLELQLHDARRSLDEGQPGVAAESATEVLDDAREHKLNRVEAKANEVLAATAERVSGPTVAMEHYRRAEELWLREPIHLRVNAITGVARCTWRLGNPQLAIHLLDSYRRDLFSAGKPHPAALMRTYTEVIYPYFMVGLPEKASEAAREALRLESKVEDQDDIACMHLTVARSLLYERQFEDAIASIRRAEEIYLAGGWRNKAAKAQIAEGIVLANKADYGAAREKLLAVLRFLEASPNLLDEALVLNELGRVSRKLGDPVDAISYLERVPALLEDSDVVKRAFNAREMGLCLQELNDPQAERFLLQAADLYRQSGVTDQLATTFKALGDLYVAHGKTDLALSTFREGIELLEERSRPE